MTEIPGGVITAIGHDRAGKLVIEINNIGYFVSDPVKDWIQKHTVRKGDTVRYRVRNKTIEFLQPGSPVPATAIKDAETPSPQVESAAPAAAPDQPEKQAPPKGDVVTGTLKPPYGLDPSTRLSLQVTISMGNYESLRVGVEGLAAEEAGLKKLLTATLGEFGKDEITREMVQRYSDRVLNGKKASGVIEA